MALSVLLAVTMAVSVLVVAVPGAEAYPRPGRTERVSMSADGTQADRDTFLTVPTMSADGRYAAFSSPASNLVAGDANNNCGDGFGNYVSCPDVFVKDRRTGAIVLVSVATDGTQGDAASTAPSISADGRYVAFSSAANNLVPGETNGRWDVFVHDRDSDGDGVFDERGAISTERVSVASDGSEAIHTYGEIAGYSRDASITPDGRYVAFTSGANNLVPNDTHGVDVFVHDRMTRRTVRVSVSSEGREAPRWSSGLTVSAATGVHTISADGRHVVFHSNVDVTTTSTSGFAGVFAHDRDVDGNGVFDEPGGIRTLVVSKSSDGTRRGSSSGGSVSGDGRFVTFQSDNTLLVPTDTNGGTDAFVHDRNADGDGAYDESGAITTERVSVSSDGAQGTGNAFKPSLSRDGRHVVFMSSSSNLVAGDTNARSDVFVHDRATRATERVSVADDGTEGDAHSPDYLFGSVNASPPSLSADGRYAVFNSQATTLVAGDTNGKADMFVRDRGPLAGVGHLSAVVNNRTVKVAGWAAFAGAVVAGASDPRNDALVGAREAGAELAGARLVARPEAEDVVVQLDVVDLGLSTVTLDSASPGTVYGLQFTVEGTRYEARATALSGRAPLFELYRCTPVCTQDAVLSGSYGTLGDAITIVLPATALDVGEATPVTGLGGSSAQGGSAGVPFDEIALDDGVVPGRAVAVALSEAGTDASSLQFRDVTASLSDGRFTGELDASSLLDGAYTVWAKACLGDVCGTSTRPLRLGAPDPDPTPTPTPTPTPSPSPSPTSTPQPQPEPEPGPSATDPRLNRTSRASQTSAGTVADDYSYQPSISANGRYTAFVSSATNLVPGVTNNHCIELVVKSCPDIYVQDGQTGIVRRLSVTSDGGQANARSHHASISADGRFVVFTSYASNLVANDTNESPDIFVHDRDTDGDRMYDERGAISTERVSVSSDGTQTARGESLMLRPSISPDGRYVAFTSVSSLLVPGDTNGAADVFLRDLVTKTTERVSLGNSGAQANAHAGTLGFVSTISAGGRYVAFYSTASNLVVGDTNGRYDVFVRDRQEATTTRVSVASDGAQLTFGDGALYSALSADGRYVAFQSTAANLVPGDNNGTNDVFVRDRDSDADGVLDEPGTVATHRISVAGDAREGAGGESTLPVLTGDGRYVAFESTATNLVPGDTNAAKDVFARDRLTGVTTRISVALDGGQSATGGFYPSITRDGRYAAFVSTSADLAGGDASGAYDHVYVRDLGPGVGVGRVDAATDEQSPDEVAVHGWAEWRAETISAAVDPRDDALAGAYDAGGELTAAAVAYRGDLDDLLVRLSVARLPAVYPSGSVNAGATGSPVSYTVGFRIEGVRYEVRAAALAGRAPLFDLYRCESVCVQYATLAGGYGTTGDEITASVPRGMLPRSNGALTDVMAFATSTATGEATRMDEVALPDAEIPLPTLAATIAPAGTAQEDVTFAALSPAGSEFAATLDVTDLPWGLYDVWAKACLGPTCGATSVPLRLGPPPTSLLLTERSARAGQYSDEVLVETLLTGADGAPVVGAPVTFELGDGDAVETAAATTDDRGLATATLTLRQRPGEYQLTARYAGADGAQQPANATTPFAVEREDSATSVTVEGKGSKRVLTAHLRDADDPANAIAGRTVTFSWDGEPFAAATTDANGVARVAVPPNAKAPFVADFVGDAFYRPSSMSTS